jgi:hypothetical protein
VWEVAAILKYAMIDLVLDLVRLLLQTLAVHRGVFELGALPALGTPKSKADPQIPMVIDTDPCDRAFPLRSAGQRDVDRGTLPIEPLDDFTPGEKFKVF